MDKGMMECMLHPIRMRIVQEIIKRENVTTKELLEVFSDIPQATLYRNLNRLLKDNIIKIASENKIRGVIEKVYEINVNPYEKVGEIIEENNKKELLNIFYNFNMSLIGDFQNFLEDEEVDLMKEIFGFRSYSAYLTDDEAKEMMIEIRECIAKRVDNKNLQGRRLRKLSTIIVPVDNK